MKFAWIAAAITLFILSGYYFQQHTLIIMQIIRDLGWLGSVIFLILYCLATVLFLPTMVLTLAGGALFGPVYGTLLNLLGATLGASCAFCISRHLSKDWLSTQNSKRWNKLIKGVNQRGWPFVALLRVIPVIPFNLVNYALGITQIKFHHYVLITFIFLTPGEILFTFFGYASINVLGNMHQFYKYLCLFILLGTFISWFYAIWNRSAL